MKSFIVIAGMALLVACSSSSSTKNDLARFGYQGDVKRLITYKYMNYQDSLPLDSGAFNYRTLYDYTKDGLVSYMQFVMNRSRQNETSLAINYAYKLKGGNKTGWQQVNMLTEDTSYGTIEWLDHTHLYERKYSSANQLEYEIITELDSLSFEERIAEIKYPEGHFRNNQKIWNMKAIDGSNYYIETDLVTRQADTVWISILNSDKQGNATELIETRSSTQSKTFIRKEFSYY